MKIMMVMMEGHGGQYQYGALLANALSQSHTVSAIVPWGAETAYFDASVEVIRLHVGDTVSNILPNTLKVGNLRHFVKAVKERNPDILHYHNPYNPWVCLALPWIRKYPMVISMPEGILHLGMHKRWEMVIARKIHVWFSDAIIALYEWDKARIASYARNKKILIIPHGVNPLFLRYAREDIKEENAVLFFGGIAPFKGLDYLLRAFPMVREKVPDVRLIIAGRGKLDPYRSLLDKLDNVELDNRFIPPEKVAEYFQRTRMVILPYIEEDHSGMVPVAYSFSKPVVVSELVSGQVGRGKTGLVVPPRDEKALAEAITQLLTNHELRREMGQNAHRRATQELSWDKIVEKTLQVYAEVTKKQG